MPEYYVYLKTGAYSEGDGSTTNTIPLRAVSVNISTQKNIPSFPIPLSGAVTGESLTAALDLGMATKNISINGFIVDGTITRHGTAFEMTAQEIAQLIHSSVDSTSLADHQAITELVILIPSKVDETYTQHATTVDIPWSFRARGDSGLLDNTDVPVALKFPTRVDSAAGKHAGLKGFVRSFGTPLEADTVEINFSMEFEVATIIP
tara:strand:- start:658 stop:1275 length:618 start_codon:yes stop_codon:yes gene_type:complete